MTFGGRQTLLMSFSSLLAVQVDYGTSNLQSIGCFLFGIFAQNEGNNDILCPVKHREYSWQENLDLLLGPSCP